MRPIHAMLHALNEGYPYVLILVYVIAFIVAFAMMFIMPQISLLLLFVGLYSLALAVGLGKMARSVERRLARSMLDRGICPHCGAVFTAPFTSPCPSCLTSFESHPAIGTGEAVVHGQGGGSSI